MRPRPGCGPWPRAALEANLRIWPPTVFQAAREFAHLRGEPVTKRRIGTTTTARVVPDPSRARSARWRRVARGEQERWNATAIAGDDTCVAVFVGFRG